MVGKWNLECILVGTGGWKGNAVTLGMPNTNSRTSCSQPGISMVLMLFVTPEWIAVLLSELSVLSKVKCYIGCL